MGGKWDPEKQHYEFYLSERELGFLLFALTVARYETNDKDVAKLSKDFKTIMER